MLHEYDSLHSAYPSLLKKCFQLFWLAFDHLMLISNLSQANVCGMWMWKLAILETSSARKDSFLSRQKMFSLVSVRPWVLYQGGFCNGSCSVWSFSPNKVLICQPKVLWHDIRITLGMKATYDINWLNASLSPQVRIRTGTRATCTTKRFLKKENCQPLDTWSPIFKNFTWHIFRMLVSTVWVTLQSHSTTCLAIWCNYLKMSN